jgi:hypothetical protein
LIPATNLEADILSLGVRGTALDLAWRFQSPLKTSPHRIVFPKFFFHSPGIIAMRARSGCLSDEKENRMREVDHPEIRSTNILFVCGNKSQSRAVWRMQQVKIL